MEMQADPRFASVTGLGEFSKLYESSKLGWWVCAILLMVFLAGSAFVIYQGYPQTQNCLWFVPIGVLVLVAPMLLGRWALALYEGGLAYHDWRGLRRIQWQDISHLYETWGWAGGDEYSSAEFTRGLRIGLKEGRDLRLPEDLSDLWDMINEKVLPRLLQEARAAIRAGETLDFGAFHVSAEGLRLTHWPDKRFVEWRNVRWIDVWPDPSTPHLCTIGITVETDARSQGGVWPPLRIDVTREPALFLAVCRDIMGADPSA